jgi:hypothetical protein
MQTSSFLRLQPWVGTSEISNNPCMLMLPIDVCRLGSRWPLLSPARSLAPDEVDPFGSVWAPDRGRTATSNIYRFCSDAVRPVPPRPSVPCVLSLGVSQSVSQSVACNRNRAYYCHTLNEPAGHRRAARRPIPTDGWFYVTIRYDMNTLFFVLF